MGKSTGFLCPLFPCPFLPHFQHLHSHKFSVFTGNRSRCHSDKRIVSPAGGDGVELVLPSLEALLHLFFQICPGYLLHGLLVQAQLSVFLNKPLVGFSGKRLQYIVHTGHGKTAVLLAGRAQDNVPDDVKGCVQCLGLIVPQVPHLKSPVSTDFTSKRQQFMVSLLADMSWM